MVAAGVSLVTPEIDSDWLNFTAPLQDPDRNLKMKRQGCTDQAVRVDKMENFVDWDVQISPVVCAVGAMTVAVTEGWSIANSVGVSAGISQTLVKDLLSVSLGINYSKTWTTTTSIAVTGNVPDGQCGAMIWKPLTTRRYGTVLKGCVGDMQPVGTFIADDRGSSNFGGIEWAAGARSMCIKPGSNPPLSRCQGDGNFV